MKELSFEKMGNVSGGEVSGVWYLICESNMYWFYSYASCLNDYEYLRMRGEACYISYGSYW